MPRDGSSSLPPGAVPAAPMDIGEVANPPFAVLPKPLELFARRAERFQALAEGHELEQYLRFLASVCRAQSEIQESLPVPAAPDAATLATAREHAMPAVSLPTLALDELACLTFTRLAEALAKCELSAQAQASVDAIAAAKPKDREAMLRAVIDDEIPEDRVAEHVIAAAALQVHLARIAAQLDADSLVRVADGACPSCGGQPVTSMIVGWEGSHGTRFCTCALCQTQWNVPRIRCLVCGNEKGISYHSLEGGKDTVSGETCGACSSYVKILHQHKEPGFDPVADDVASLALDLVLGREGWRRASVNPFLIGY